MSPCSISTPCFGHLILIKYDDHLSEAGSTIGQYFCNRCLSFGDFLCSLYFISSRACRSEAKGK